MGANFKFDEMLPTIHHNAGDVKDPCRQVEVFTHGGHLFLRIGQVNEQDTGTNRYTVQLSKDAAEKVIAAIQRGIDYLNLPG